MYFSQRDRNAEPLDEILSALPELVSELQNDLQEEDLRDLLDADILSSLDDEIQTTKSMPDTKSSFSLGADPPPAIVNFITDAIIKSHYREMTATEFKESYLAPLNKAMKRTVFTMSPSKQSFQYPVGNPEDEVKDIQRYYDHEVNPATQLLYRQIHGKGNYFGNQGSFRAPLSRSRLVKPDIVHYYKKSKTDPPSTCFAIGDFEKGAYKLTEGFIELKNAIEKYRLNLENGQLQKTPTLFDVDWSNGIVFALIFRRCLYQAFISGTDRVFISDHQKFSGFFQYEFKEEDQMYINYYIINNPETTDHGITLRSAIGSFFYKEFDEAFEIKMKLAEYIELAKKSLCSDILSDIYVNSQKKSRSLFKLPNIKKVGDGEEELIKGNSICKVVYDAAKCFPDLGTNIPSKVFIKLYHYFSRTWEMNSLMDYDINTQDQYYSVFFNELLINKRISKSQYAANFPKILASGYCNGLPDNPIHVFEYLGEEIPFGKWNKYKVYKKIKTRIEELHKLGITHNDIRVLNIHVSVSGKISLIDFGLSDFENNPKRKRKDFERLEEIFEDVDFNDERK